MRLTHFVKIDGHDRDSVQASICPAADAVGDASIRISQDVPGGPANVVWLTIAEHDVIADLVWAHRPDSATKDAEIVSVACGATLEGDTLPCVLSPGHNRVVPGWEHIDRDGRKFNT